MTTSGITRWFPEFIKYLNSGEYADFTIRCRGYEWKVHRIVIAAASPYFERIASGPFKESSEGCVDLSDDDPDIIARLILYMYFGDHFEYIDDDVGWESIAKLLNCPAREVKLTTCVLDAELVAAADKYQMPDALVSYCKIRYIDRMEFDWSSLREESSVFDFIASVKIIYQAAPTAGLRGRAITTAQEHITPLQHIPEFLDLLAIPDFAVDLVTKGLWQSLWCKLCVQYVKLEPDQPAEDGNTENDEINEKYDEIWDWIDYGKPQKWGWFACRGCDQKGTCTEARPT